MTTRYDNSGAADWALETRAIHVGQSPDAQTSARNLPIYNTSSYVFDSAEHAANRFNLSDAGPIYSRLTNPTVDAVEQRIAGLDPLAQPRTRELRQQLGKHLVEAAPGKCRGHHHGARFELVVGAIGVAGVGFGHHRVRFRGGTGRVPGRDCYYRRFAL